MDNHQHNIIIVGSGLVGMTLALMLSRQQYKVLILDKSSKKELLEVKDSRTSAISQGSSRILKEISIWNKIKNKAQPINEIYVSEGKNRVPQTRQQANIFLQQRQQMIVQLCIKRYLLKK